MTTEGLKVSFEEFLRMLCQYIDAKVNERLELLGHTSLSKKTLMNPECLGEWGMPYKSQRY